MSQNNPPFKKGDLVRIKGNDHLGIHRVDECEWFERTNPGVAPYWLVTCGEAREVNWDNILPGQCGIVMPGIWSGSADRLELLCAAPAQDSKE